MHPVFIVGCGQIGGLVARRWKARGARVSALARSANSATRLREMGVRPVAGDLDRPECLHGLPLSGALIYYFAPPPARGQQDTYMRAFTAALTDEPLPTRVVYISTSGVYGDARGEWVDEQTPPNPGTDRARRRLDAETTLRQWGINHNVPVVILRVGGIYGPGRLPVERLKKGLPVLREEESLYTNRIHSEDLADICVAAAERGRPDAVYNVSDGQNGTMTEYFNAVADKLGLPRPPTVSMEEARRVMSPAMLSYLTESRRMENRRMVEELAVTLRYPDLEAGLGAIDAEEELRREGE